MKENNRLRVCYHGRPVGTLALTAGGMAAFEYDRIIRRPTSMTDKTKQKSGHIPQLIPQIPGIFRVND